MEEQQLIEAAREGKEWAGPFLVSLHGPALAGYCHSVAGDLSDTDREHVVANAIERAVRRIDKFDPDRGSFKAWLRGFVVYAARDWRRHHAHLVELDAARLADRETPGARSDAESQPSQLQPMIDPLREALPKLRPPDQLILVMRDYEGRSVEDCASRLQITPEACRQRHHRARQRLKALMEQDARLIATTGESP